MRWDNVERFSAAKTDTNICGPKRKRRGVGSYVCGHEDENPMLRVILIAKKKAGQTG